MIAKAGPSRNLVKRFETFILFNNLNNIEVGESFFRLFSASILLGLVGVDEWDEALVNSPLLHVCFVHTSYNKGCRCRQL
jgi:hypothetical protein